MVQLLQQHLVRVQQRQKQQADKHRSERSFVVGDMVFLKIQPYVQSSLHKKANHKLSFKYFGPYKIVQKIGDVAYCLQLPAYSSIHPVFHVSLPKKAVGTDHQVHNSLQSLMTCRFQSRFWSAELFTRMVSPYLRSWFSGRSGLLL